MGRARKQHEDERGGLHGLNHAVSMLALRHKPGKPLQRQDVDAEAPA